MHANRSKKGFSSFFTPGSSIRICILGILTSQGQNLCFVALNGRKSHLAGFCQYRGLKTSCLRLYTMKKGVAVFEFPFLCHIDLLGQKLMFGGTKSQKTYWARICQYRGLRTFYLRLQTMKNGIVVFEFPFICHVDLLGQRLMFGGTKCHLARICQYRGLKTFCLRLQIMKNGMVVVEFPFLCHVDLLGRKLMFGGRKCNLARFCQYRVLKTSCLRLQTMKNGMVAF